MKKSELIDLIQYLQNKEIPKAPYYAYGYMHCKECGFIVNKKDNYCALCGQLLDWSDNI